MPEVLFDITWPDGTAERCYSPSTAIKAHLAPGESYSLAEFLARSRAGLTAASERVRLRFGMPCGQALGQLARIEARVGGFPAEGRVTVTALHE